MVLAKLTSKGMEWLCMTPEVKSNTIQASPGHDRGGGHGHVWMS